ncbi:MAG: helix-turn-helix transcriptional regulator [Verrucomicrobia bacterium]|nr:helix-turn-helix transcriptional regulator [Verrucomicrobiota bacterium]
MVSIEEKLGLRIAQLRQKAKLTQAQLAEACGYSVNFIGLVERGINAPSVSGLERVARVLKVEVKELFAFEEKKR